ncbi:MAG TPA: hypothetical protein VHW72_22255 [Candidatus Angelobacter sp.]|jgi:cellulose biosynthesis protein BcsQ|nr:hypothetical protein [Candidatus Angelobacter sp.]
MARFVTFYSYKGGTGRSMALANIAWIMASNGYKVLVIDWDLEAPGLHRYFAPFLPDREMKTTSGLIDFVREFVLQALTPPASSEGAAPNWYQNYANIRRYATSLRSDKFKFGDKTGTIDFVGAGKQDSSYAIRFNSFSWAKFYVERGGSGFLDEMKKQLEDYDYVLIDSRTGVSDTSSICTVHLPDVLVVCFTMNNQSIEGGAAVARSVAEEAPRIRILPVAMRVQLGEKEKLNRRRDLANQRFSEVIGASVQVPDATRAESGFGSGFGSDFGSGAKPVSTPLAAVLTSTEVPHDPYYGYEEILATIADRPGSPNSVLAAMERLTASITEGRISNLQNPVSSEEREKILENYAGTGRPKERKGEEKKPVWSRWEIAASTGLVLLFVVLGIVLNRNTPPTVPDVRIMNPHKGPVFAAVFSPDSQKCIITAAKVVQVWNCFDSEPKDPLEWQESLPSDPVGLANELDQPRVLFGLWNELGEFDMQTHHIARISLPPFGPKGCETNCSITDVFSAGSGDGRKAIVRTSLREVLAAGLSADSKLASNGIFGYVGIDNAIAGNNHLGPVLIGFRRESGELFVDQPGTDTFPRTISIHYQDVSALGFEPKDGIVAVASDSIGVILYQMQSGLQLKTLTDSTLSAPRYSTTSIAFSPDGTLMATTGTDKLIRIWDVQQGTLRKTLSGHDGIVYRATFNADGTLLLTASSDGTARLWSVPKQTSQ